MKGSFCDMFSPTVNCMHSVLTNVSKREKDRNLFFYFSGKCCGQDSANFFGKDFFSLSQAVNIFHWGTAMKLNKLNISVKSSSSHIAIWLQFFVSWYVFYNSESCAIRSSLTRDGRNAITVHWKWRASLPRIFVRYRYVTTDGDVSCCLGLFKAI